MGGRVSLCAALRLQCSTIIVTSRYPVGISTKFCFRWQKNLHGGKGKGIRGEKEKKKKKIGEKN